MERKIVIEYIRRVLDNAKGDDLERATAAFRGCTPDRMQEEYGQSGRTRQEILDSYQQQRAIANQAVEFFNRLVEPGTIITFLHKPQEGKD